MQTSTPVSADFATCPHDRGPGIAVCLRCRAEAHRRAAASRRRIATRLSVGAMVALVLVIAGTRAVGAPAGSGPAPVAAGPRADSGRAESFQVAQAGATEPTASSVTAPAAAPAAATEPTDLVRISAGRTDLADGMFAERSGDSVSVHFDTQLFRTRRHDKFDRVVRMTLPAVYGAAADSALAAVPEGTLGGRDDLLNVLPERGIALPARAGWALTVWPTTRPGQDGPLVVSYRVTIAPAK